MSAPKKQRLVDKVEIEEKKSKGLLVYDQKVSGTSRLPHCPIFGKAHKDSATEERFCMQFMTVGHYCSRHPCPYPHHASLNRLSDEARKKFCAWVDKQPGLQFAPGRGPAGAP